MTFLQPAVRLGRKFQNPVPTELGGLSLMLEVLPRYLTNREERFPRLPLGPFHTDPETYRNPPASGLRVTWFGHSSSLLEIDGVRILIDPVWDERASPVTWFGPRRFFPPTIPLENLPPLDAVLISHDHYDHLGAQTVRRLAILQPHARWVTSAEVGGILRRFGVARERIAELDWTGKTVVAAPTGAACEIVSAPARHFSGRSLRNRFETLWASFVIRGSGPAAHAVYYGADSGEWPGYVEIGEAYGPFDLTMLEIGAYDPLWHGIHLGPAGAGQAYNQLGSKGLLMPIHWGLFDLALHAWRQPIQQMESVAREAGIPLWYPTPGEPAEVHRGVAHHSGWWRATPA